MSELTSRHIPAVPGGGNRTLGRAERKGASDRAGERFSARIHTVLSDNKNYNLQY